MTLLETLNYFIEDQKEHLECLEWVIREESNFTDNEHPGAMEDFCRMREEARERLANLKLIKHFLMNSGIIHKEEK